MQKTQKNFKESILDLSGSVVALVYTFQNEEAPGFTHYEFWKSEVITAWLSAVEEIGCKPYILDVKTFMMKASMGTLPHIDYCINLNAGNNNVDNLCLVPAICSFCGIPCIPCSAKACGVGEDKVYANLIAESSKLKLPKTYPFNKDGGIIRDRSLGSSVGIRLSSENTVCSDMEICQEFIVGTDMTIPILFNPLSKQLEVLPAVAYKHDKGAKWFLDAKAKLTHSYEKVLVQLSKEAEQEVLSLAKKFDITTYCRIDTRIKNFQFDRDSEVKLDDIYFIEINPTPTINNTINFALSLQNSKDNLPHKQLFNAYKNSVEKASITGYILLCSLLAIKAKHFLSPG
ncbi:MAG: hypothetical protein K2O28_04815 [Clostridia bacterium]|nr:hypothetical protein [Clostridia bacterium]